MTQSTTTRTLLPAAMLVLLACAAYLPVINAGYIWDDDAYVTDNPTLRSAEGLRDIWFKPGATPQYYPLVFSSFWIEYRLWGLDPVGYHVVNVVLHVLTALLWWRLLHRLGVPGAWLAATIFALHPVHVESVAWVTERKNVLSGFFYVAAALSYLSFKPQLTGDGRTSRSCTRAYVNALLLLLAALLSKTVTATLPAALLLVTWWKTGRITRRDIWPLLPMFVMGLVLGLVTVWLEKTHVGASGAEWALSPVQRWLVAGRVAWFYAGKLFWPVPLIFNYERWSPDVGSVVQHLYPLGVIAVVVVLWLLRHRLGRGPLVAVLFFLGTLLPALGFFDVYPFRYSFVADHFQYLASMGLIALAAALIWSRLRNVIAHPVVQYAVTLPLLLLLGGLTFQQARIYENVETLWLDTLAKNPRSWLSHVNLARHYQKQDQWERAEQRYLLALRFVDEPTVFNDLGTHYLGRDDPARAIEQFDHALRRDPNNAIIWLNKGLAFYLQQNIPRAIEHYRQALLLDPSFADAHYNLGLAYRATGQPELAADHFEKGLRLAEDDDDMRHNLALTYVSLARLTEAKTQLEKLVNKPDTRADWHSDLATVLVQLGRMDQAIEHLERATQVNPAFIPAWRNLSLVLGQLERYEQALPAMQRWVQLQPDDAAAHYNLASVLQRLSNQAQALEHYEHSSRLAPQVPDPWIAIAMLCAASTDERVRSTDKALLAGERACELTQYASPLALDAFAAAQAQAGRFDQAATLAQNAVTLARSHGLYELATLIETRLAMYRLNQPYRLESAK